jgi:hypothetical protein
MKHASWVVAGCLIAAGIAAQPAHSQQTVEQYALPAGSVGTMTSSDPTSTHSAYIKDPTPEQVRAAWGSNTPNKSSAHSAYVKDPSPEQVRASWGLDTPNKSSYNPYHPVGK